MADDARTTKKFPKVVVPIAPLPAGAEKVALPATPSEPGLPPDWYEDPPTVPSASVAIEGAHGVVAPERALLTVLLGVNAGQIFAIDRVETVIGRGRDAHVRIDEVGVSRRHARVVRADEGRLVLEDLSSTNGIFVNGRRVERVDLADGDRVQVGPALVLRFGRIAADEEALARQLYEGSTRDALTQLYNRKYAQERLTTEIAYAHRQGTLLSFVLFDIDHFKRINDGFGHLAGDVVLRVVAAQAQRTVRSEDVLARYGGEEFCVIVRGIEHKNVMVLAERVRGAIERLSIPWQARTLKVTLSGGVASLRECGASVKGDALVALADKRLYEAKQNGRNRIC